MLIISIFFSTSPEKNISSREKGIFKVNKRNFQQEEESFDNDFRGKSNKNEY